MFYNIDFNTGMLSSHFFICTEISRVWGFQWPREEDDSESTWKCWDEPETDES